MKYIILGHENPDVDSILSGILLEKILSRKDNNNIYKYVIPDKEVDEITTKIVKDLGINIDNYKNINIEEDDELILVDHHEEKRFNNKINAIYDHHPTVSEIDTKDIDEYHNLKSCSTTTVISQLFDKYITKEDFILVLVGALVDTVSFRSSKTNPHEVIYLIDKCNEFNINPANYLDIGLCLNDISDLKKSYLYGLKKYIIQNKNVESSYIQIKNVKENRNNIMVLIYYIQEYIKKNNIDIFVFIVHDMDNFKTTTYEISNDDLNIIEYDSYTSRGSTIIPNLNKKLLKKL